MARLGGMWAGVSAGLDSIVEGNERRADRALKEKTAELQNKRFEMDMESHGYNVAAQKRKDRPISVKMLEDTIGKKDPSGFEYGVEHATQMGYIQTNPDTGEQWIRQEDLENTRKHMDSATGVQNISGRNILRVKGLLDKEKDPAKIKTLQDELNTHIYNNQGALKAMEARQRSEDRELDRQNRIELREMMIAGRGGGGGGNSLTRTEKLEENANKRLDRYNDKWQAGIDRAKKQYAADMDEKGEAYANENWNATVKGLRDSYEPLIKRVKSALDGEDRPARRQLGGGPPTSSAPTSRATTPTKNSAGLSYADLVKPMADAKITTASQGVDILTKNFGYKPEQAREIMRDILKAGYIK